MKNLILIIILYVTLTGYCFGQEQYSTFKVTDDIEVIKISENAYVHVSYFLTQSFGRVASNGMILVENGKAILLDTPMTNELTGDLVKWIEKELKVKIVSFVPNHWHNDCIGGLDYIHSIGVESYANELTIKLAKENNVTPPKHGFPDSLMLKLDEKKIFCSFLGAAHSLDNIVVWLPSEKILFAGCMVKEMGAKNLGNTADGDINEYPETIKKILKKYPEARIVIPGHGKFGGVELIKHTLELAEK